LSLQEGIATQINPDDATRDTAAVKACLSFVAAKDEAANSAETEDNGISDNASHEAAKPADDQESEAYLKGKVKSKARLDARDCIGVVADRCLALDENQTSDGMMRCFSRESEVWDKLLNEAYKESITPGVGDVDSAQFKIESDHIRKVQRAWITWRDATCETLYQNGIPMYGSESKVNGVYCEMLLTARQALWLDGTEPIDFDQ
jgi:uncharacterized protein YecT (DUF1311 family)